MSASTQISRDDIRQKLVDIKTDAVSEAETKKNQALAVGGGIWICWNRFL